MFLRLCVLVLFCGFGLIASPDVSLADTKIVEATLNCKAGKTSKYKRYRAVLTGTVDEKSFSLAREYFRRDGNRGVNILNGYIKKNKLIVKGSGFYLHNNDKWDFFGSVKINGNVESQLKQGISVRHAPGKKNERKCKLKWSRGETINKIRADLLFYERAKEKIETLKAEIEELKSAANASPQQPSASAETTAQTASSSEGSEAATKTPEAEALPEVAPETTAAAPANASTSDEAVNAAGGTSQDQPANVADAAATALNLANVAEALKGVDLGGLDQNELMAKLGALVEGAASPTNGANAASPAIPRPNPPAATPPVTTAAATTPAATTAATTPPATTSPVTTAAASEPAADVGKNIEIYLSTHAFNIAQKLDGSMAYLGDKRSTLEMGYFCFYWRLADYGENTGDDSEKFFDQFIWPAAIEALQNAGIDDISRAQIGGKEDCERGIKDHWEVNEENYSTVSLVFMQRRHNQNFGEKFHDKFKKFAEVPGVQVTESIEVRRRQTQEIYDLYDELAQTGALTHVGSITILAPADSHVRFCGYARDEVLREPLKILPEFAPIEKLVHSDIAGPVRALIDRRRARDIRGMRIFSSLDEFFQQWQVNDDCHVFAAHPQDLTTFIEAAKNLRSEFGFLVNPIWDINTLMVKEVEKRGYSQVDQIHLEAKLKVSSGTVIDLAEFGIYGIDDYGEAEAEMKASGFASSGNASRVLEFLKAKKVAQAKGMTVSEMVEAERLAEEAKWKQIRKIHNLETAQGFGDAAFIATVFEDHLMAEVSCENFHSVMHERSEVFFRSVKRKIGPNRWKMNFIPNQKCKQATNCPDLDQMTGPHMTWLHDDQKFWSQTDPDKPWTYEIQNDQYATYRMKRMLEDGYGTGRYLFCK